MTKADAQKQARALWGRAGDADRRSDAARGRRFVVGVQVQHEVGPYFEVRGAGASYEEAFQDAEAHADVPPVPMPKLEHLLELAKAKAAHDMEKRLAKEG